MLTPLNVQTITHRTGIAAVVDLGLIPEEVVEMLAARNAVRAAIVPPGDYVLHLDADGMGVRATPISVEHPLADLGDLRL